MANNLEVLEKEETPKVEEIHYYRPKFWKRVSAIFFDAILCILLSTAFFIGVNEIVKMQPSYIEELNELNEKKKDSSIFLVDDRGLYIDIVSYYNKLSDTTPGAKKIAYEHAIDEFIIYIESFDEEKANEIQKQYDEFRLNPGSTYNGEPYFIKDNDIIIQNPNISIPSRYYNENIYEPFLDNYAQAYFINSVPNVLNIQKNQAYLLFFLEIPISLLLGVIIIYLVFPLIFYRGRKTLGRLVFNLGLVDKNVLNVSFLRYLARFGIQFLEIIISVGTVCVPLIISFTMMAFSKKKQTFHDYMLGIEEIDTEGAKIYLNIDEATGVQKESKYDLDTLKYKRK